MKKPPLKPPTLHAAAKSLVAVIAEHGEDVPLGVRESAKAVGKALEYESRAKRAAQAGAKTGPKPHPKRDECLRMLRAGMTPAEVVRETGVSRPTVDRYRRTM